MTDKRQFDFWYAVNNTEVLQLPQNKLETFGNSVVHYHLLTELMDSTDKVRVREGRIETFRPEIITPNRLAESILEGFGQEAERYAQWLQQHQSDLLLLQYGFSIRKREINDHIVSENIGVAVEQVRSDLGKRDDPLSALLIGVEEPWEVCLLKLMVEVIQDSAPKNLSDLRADPDGTRHAVEKMFRAASQNAKLIPELHRFLDAKGLFEQYQDRFFALVRRARS